MLRSGRPLGVVAIEDSPVFLDRLGALVREIQGMELVGTAGDVVGAVRLIGTSKPDVALLDVGLRDGSGIEVLRHLKSHGLKTTVLVMTNQPSVQLRDQCLTLGAADFFDKSLELQRMKDALVALRLQSTSSD